jgi:hypothetical protein
MKRSLVIIFLFFASAPASVLRAGIVTPDDIGGPYCVSPAFGSAACGITNEYEDSGIVFDGRVAVFNDPPNAWGGISGTGIVDLVSSINGHLVLPGTSTLAVTDFLSVEIGFSGEGSLLFEVFDVHGFLLASTLNDDGIGPHDRTLATLKVPGIHSFRVSGLDSWGMNQIEYGNLPIVSRSGRGNGPLPGAAPYRGPRCAPAPAARRAPDPLRRGRPGAW